MKELLVALAAAFAASASAGTLTLATTVLYHDAPFASGNITYADVTDADVAFILKHAKGVVDAGSKQQDKGGPFTVRLSQTGTNDAGAKTDQPEVELQGVTTAGAAKIMRAQQRAAGLMLSTVEKNTAPSGKKPWGKKDK